MRAYKVSSPLQGFVSKRAWQICLPRLWPNMAKVSQSSRSSQKWMPCLAYLRLQYLSVSLYEVEFQVTPVGIIYLVQVRRQPRSRSNNG